ncbi:277_t:CDS:2, partial [Cetraspora pellucida]
LSLIMTSDCLFVKLTEHLYNLKTEHIMAATLIYQGLEKNPWISKNKLRGIVNRAVDLIKSSTTTRSGYDNIDFPISPPTGIFLDSVEGVYIEDHICFYVDDIVPYKALFFDIAFDTISNLLDVGVIKMNGKSKLYQRLFAILNGMSTSELTWEDPLSSQVIRYNSKLVQQLNDKQRKKFKVCKLTFLVLKNLYPVTKVKFISSKKPAEDMIPATIPSFLQEECIQFVSNFSTQNMWRLPYRLLHTREWKENEDQLKEVALKILETLGIIWRNPAFRPEFVESLSEGTCVSNVIVPLIRATLFHNSFGKSAFISTQKRRRENGKATRHYVRLYGRYELTYSECSRITCTKQKEDDDDVKLWRESNDGMYWAHKSRRLEKEQFGIIGIQ